MYVTERVSPHAHLVPAVRARDEEALPGQTVEVIVLGAPDCKFVIPLLRAGHRVTAVEC